MLQELERAAEAGNLAVAQKILQGLVVAGREADARGLLIRAAYENQAATVSGLLNAGLDALSCDELGQTALHWAAARGNAASSRALLQHAVSSRASSSMSAKLLLEAKNRNGMAALHLAAEADSAEEVKVLLGYGADVAFPASGGRTALHVAAEKGAAVAASTLLSGVIQPLRVALLTVEARDGSALACAAARGHVGVMEVLVEARADPNKANRQAFAPLHLAARGNHTAAAAFLLRVGASVTAESRDKETPLHVAAANGAPGVTKLLLEAGAQIDAQDSKGRCALQIAESSKKPNCMEVVKLLMNPPLVANEGSGDSNETNLHELADERRGSELNAVEDLGDEDAISPTDSATHEQLKEVSEYEDEYEEDEEESAIDGESDEGCDEIRVPETPEGPAEAHHRIGTSHSNGRDDDVVKVSEDVTQPVHLFEKKEAVDEPDHQEANATAEVSEHMVEVSCSEGPQAEVGEVVAQQSWEVEKESGYLDDSEFVQDVYQGLDKVEEEQEQEEQDCGERIDCTRTEEASQSGHLVDALRSAREVLVLQSEHEGEEVAEVSLSKGCVYIDAREELLSQDTRALEPGAVVAEEEVDGEGECRPIIDEQQSAEAAAAARLDLTLRADYEAVARAEAEGAARAEAAAARRILEKAKRALAVAEADATIAMKLAAKERRRRELMETLVNQIRQKGNGSVALMWRRYAAVDGVHARGDGRLGYREFCNFLMAMELYDVESALPTWRAFCGEDLDDDFEEDVQSPSSSQASDHRLGLEAFDSDAASIVYAFGHWIRENFGGTTEIFSKIDAYGTGLISPDEFLINLKRFGFFEGADLPDQIRDEASFRHYMLPLIDPWGNGCVLKRELIFLETDPKKRRKCKLKLERERESAMPLSGVAGATCELGAAPSQRSGAAMLLNGLAKKATPLGGKNWAQVVQQEEDIPEPSPRFVQALAAAAARAKTQAAQAAAKAKEVRAKNMMRAAKNKELRLQASHSTSTPEVTTPCSSSAFMARRTGGEGIRQCVSLPRLLSDTCEAVIEAPSNAIHLPRISKAKMHGIYGSKQTAHLPFLGCNDKQLRARQSLDHHEGSSRAARLDPSQGGRLRRNTPLAEVRGDSGARPPSSLQSGSIAERVQLFEKYFRPDPMLA